MFCSQSLSKSEILPVYVALPYIFTMMHVYRITTLYTERSYYIEYAVNYSEHYI